MILPWKNYLQTNEVSFQLTDDIKYIAYPNGEYGILKQETGKDDILLNDVEWQVEKQWISDNFSDVYGVYEPCTHDELEDGDDKECLFGKTSDGKYLDRIQRPEPVMNHDMTSLILSIEGWGKIHTPDNGETLWKTEWHPTRNEFYNCMRCDVFPENPGWKRMDRDDVYRIIRENPSNLHQFGDEEKAIEALENRKWISPNVESTIIGEWLIP